MEKRIDSLRTLSPENVELEDLAKQDVIFVDKFSKEWTKYLNVPKDEMVVELEKLEDRIDKQLNL